MFRSKAIPTALALSLGLAGACFAQTLSLAPISVSAEVPTNFSLNVTFLDAASGQLLPEMDFGTLEASDDVLGSKRSVKVLVQMNVNGSPYSLAQTTSPLVREGGDEAIPPQALTIRPLYETPLNGNQDIPVGATVAPSGPASTVNTLYTDPNGQGRTLSVFYSLSPNPASGPASKVPSDQRGGSYAGTVQFTLTPA